MKKLLSVLTMSFMICVMVTVLSPLKKVKANPNDRSLYKDISMYNYINVYTSENTVLLTGSSSGENSFTEVILIPQGVFVGQLKYAMGTFRDDKLVDGKYFDGFVIDLIMKPQAAKYYTKYKTYKVLPAVNNSEYNNILLCKKGWEKTSRSTLVECANELLNISTYIPPVSNMPYQVNLTPYTIYGGADICGYSPKRTNNGSTNYNVSFVYDLPSFANLIFSNIEINTKYLDVIDKTSRISGKYSISFDYNLTDSLGFVNQERRNVVYSENDNNASLFWYCTDSSYSQAVNLDVEFTLIDVGTQRCTFTKSAVLHAVH